MGFEFNERRTFGRRGLTLPILGFGTGPLGGSMRSTPAQDAMQALDTAWEAGIRHFDTAPQYGHGLAEHRLGLGLRARERTDWLLSTKVGRLLRPRRPGSPPSKFADAMPFDIEFDYSFDGALRSLEDSMQRLGTDRIDFVMIHDVSVKWQGTRVGTVFRLAMDGAYRALERLRTEGVIRAIGLGMNDCETAVDFLRAGDFDYVMIAGRYTLLDLSARDRLFVECMERDVGVMMAGPFNSGILATGTTAGAVFQYGPASTEIQARVNGIQAVCTRHQIPLQAAALQFPLLHPAVTSIVAGFRNGEELNSAAHWLRHPIHEDLWRELDESGLVPGATAPACPTLRPPVRNREIKQGDRS
ncbi:aldo/keto reductase [Candidimonas nitroreducens]|uniref:Pyridoxal 4-dehydrogenase n=1 Tax=Candidimonas nitroreducens TaxID=683354 RepID=A0A225M7Y5_9BURK|nr:aldo/keto reductase [Candidimonas nitroreducens]OWT57388.1 pyridoxal 4-dehydrogenase [Candidimonas nitroreducens]